MATQLRNKVSIEAIIHEMTIQEKARLVIGGSPFHSEAIPEYGIPAVYMIDSCNGLNETECLGDAMYFKLADEAAAAGQPLDREKNGFMGGLLAAFGAVQKAAMEQAEAGAKPAKKELGCYPPGISLGSTWNPEVVEKNSRALAREMAGKGIDMILGPNINIHRDPLCGRLAESISEDPCLTSAIAVAQIKGIQEEGLLACAKHFAANNQEKDRFGVEEHVSERALREIYLPAFKACSDAGVASMMSAYNKLNGYPSAMNSYLLTDILRGEWGFEGFVVSDWGASYDQVAAVAAGTDLTMPGPRGINCICDAVANGTLPEEKLDNCVRHFLGMVLQAPAFSGKRPDFDMDETIRATDEAAREAMILLKNDGTLPLRTDTDVAFFGKRSKKFVSCPAGSSKVETDLLTNPYDRAVELLGEEHVAYEHPAADTKYWIVTVGADGQEGTDRTNLDIEEDEKEVLEAAIVQAKAAGGKVILIINATGPVNLEGYLDRVNAVICPFFAGMNGGKASADAIFGLYNPSGKLPLTWPKHEYDCPAYKNYPGENKEVWYGEGMYVGYRWYDARHIEVRFPFGYGLSYTTFELSDLDVADSVNVDQEKVMVSVKVKNIGAQAGAEVVQVYVHDVSSKIDKPKKQLKGFQKVFLQPGEETTVTIGLNKNDFAGYCLEFSEWVTEPGEFDILVGTSAGDLPFVKRVDVKCRNPFGISEKTGIGAIAQNDAAVKAINEIINDDILVIAKVGIEFAPDKAFKEIWEGTAMQGELRKKGLSTEEAAVLYERILTAFEELQNV